MHNTTFKTECVGKYCNQRASEPDALYFVPWLLSGGVVTF